MRSSSPESQIQARCSAEAAGTRYWLAHAIVVASALMVSLHTIGFDFVLYDDDYLLYRNPVVQSLENIPDFFNPWVDREGMGSEYLPLTTLSFALDYALYGDNSHGFHATNVLLYALCCWVLFLLLKRLFGDPWAAAAGAVLFAVHPLHTESFAWVSDRKSLLSGVVAFLSVLAYVNFRREGNNTRWYALSLISYLLAFLSKYTAVTLPGVFLAYDLLFVPREKRSLSKTSVLFLPFALTGLLLVALALWIGTQNEIVKDQEGALWISLFNDPVILLHYLKLLLVPIDLCAYYLWPTRSGWTPAAAAGCVVIVLLLLAAWFSRRKAPFLAFSILWFFILLLPVLNLVPKGIFLAERYLFLPLASLSLIVAWMWRRLRAEEAAYPVLRAAGLGLVLSAICVLGVLSFSRSLVWRDSVSLWSVTLEHPMANPTAYDQLGLAYLTLEKDPEKASRTFREGIAELTRRGTPLSPRAFNMRFHLVLSLLESHHIEEAQNEWKSLEQVGSQPTVLVSKQLVQDWRRALQRDYPQLFESP